MWFNSITRAKPYLTLYLRAPHGGSSVSVKRYEFEVSPPGDKNSSSDTAWSPSVHVMGYQIRFINERDPPF
jgi:hypothetical protein